MKSAIFKNQLIHLNTRSEYQRIYDYGKKDELSCPQCKSLVRLNLSIHHEPHFYHLLNSNNHCKDMDNNISKPINEIKEAATINGFRLPKGRSITVDRQEIKQPLLSTHPVLNNPPFKKEAAKELKVTANYILDLEKNGVYLDNDQYNAVISIEGPLLVLAGAGSGKTRVLTVRTAYMLTELNIEPSSIMLVTFTAKSAKEMKDRLKKYPNITNYHLNHIISGTFHSIFFRILTFHQPDNWKHDRLLKWEWQREKIVKEAGRTYDIDEKEFSYDLALQQISFWKNSLIRPQEVKPSSSWEETVAKLYADYETFKQANRYFDFDDMLLGCFDLFCQEPLLLEKYQNRFRYFLIDEFQDINRIQYELIKLLSAKSQNVCAVGDDDQSIYAFRGSDPYFILHFERDFPSTKIVTLEQNYRSTHNIVSTANRIIEKNKQRRNKKMQAQYCNSRSPYFFYPFDEEEEAIMVITDMQDKLQKGALPSDFAILYRTNSSSRAIFERLCHSNIPFVIENDAEAFYERRLVKTMLSFLKLSIAPDYSDAISNILPALFLKQTALQDLKAISILEDCTLVGALAKIKTAHAFQAQKLKRIVPLFHKLKGKNPVTAISIVEQEMGFAEYVKKRGNEGNRFEKGSDDIKDLKVAANRFDTIEQLLDHADHMTAMTKEIKKINNQYHDVVTLSTIHRSKGLEYKTVYLLGAADGSLPHEFALEALRNGDSNPFEEERRLLYVAMTRAMEDLYISIPMQYRGKMVHPSRLLKPILSPKSTLKHN